MRNGSAGHFPETNMTKYSYTQVTQADGLNKTIAHPAPVLSTNIKDAVIRIAKAQMFDKTFLLLIILSVAWSKWHYDDEKHSKEHRDEVTDEIDRIINEGDGKLHGHIAGYTTHPIRIFIPATLGAIFINIRSILT